mmetsp:Transcript_30828/g.95213  ORF Transcript_30828/g.95213 Transcript_30828/m.95213 type:complete len:127 (-) Transcript_30828:20-400(-)
MSAPENQAQARAPFEKCAICRTGLDSACVQCAAEANDEKGKCTVALGTCNHKFHSHCIALWTKRRPECPLDGAPWQLQREVEGVCADAPDGRLTAAGDLSDTSNFTSAAYGQNQVHQRSDRQQFGS